jgi:hypothetical protein
MRKARRPRVAIAWHVGVDDDGYLRLAFLTYGTGAVRVYERDRYDERAGTDLPYHERITDAYAWLAGQPPYTCCQVGTNSLCATGVLSRKDLAELATVEEHAGA